MWRDFLSNWSGSIPMSAIGADPDLATSLQTALGAQGYLDPPTDGIVGPVTNWALDAFLYVHGRSRGQGFTTDIARLLAREGSSLPPLRPSNTWIDRLVGAAMHRGFWLCRVPGCVNILYVEGCAPDGAANPNAPNRFNDLRAVVSFDASGVPRAHVWDGTTEPGTYWTFNGISDEAARLGAARIAFGQYKAWRDGVHKDHRALVQTGGPVTVHRDLNRDFSRNGDRTYTGSFGINQHWGYDLPPNDLGQSSAGCLVGRTRQGHRQFMEIVLQDPRYRANPHYTFMTGVLPRSDFA